MTERDDSKQVFWICRDKISNTFYHWTLEDNIKSAEHYLPRLNESTEEDCEVVPVRLQRVEGKE